MSTTRGHGALADRALALLLRLVLAGCLCVPVLAAAEAVRIGYDLGATGYSYSCVGGGQDTCLWISNGSVSLTFPPTQPCWQVYSRPC